MTENMTLFCIVENVQVTLPCVVSNRRGLLQWTKDGFGLGILRDMPGYPRYKLTGDEGAGEWNLEISDLAAEDDAVYQCQVSGEAGMPSLRSAPAQVKVLSAPGSPIILTQQGGHNGSVVTPEGEPLQLQCVSHGGRPAGEVSSMQHCR